MKPQFSHDLPEAPVRIDGEGRPLMPEWSDSDVGKKKLTAVEDESPKEPRKRVAKELQPDATQLDSVTQAKDWLRAHPEEAAMLRAAATATGDILVDSGVPVRFYASSEAAAFFDKTVQWLYWGMRHPPNGGRLFVEPERDENDDVVYEHVDRHGKVIDLDDLVPGEPIEYATRVKMRDIPVERIGDPITGKRRFDIPTIRKFATSAYHRGNIKEPKLRAVLQRLVVAENGGNWKAIPIPKRQEDEDAGPG